MSEILEWLVTAEDPRQQAKVKHPMADIIAIVFFAELANANEWTEIHLFAVSNKEHLSRYLALPHGIPSHDTIQRAFAMLSPECLKGFRNRWNEIMSGTKSGKPWPLTGRPSAATGAWGGRRTTSSAPLTRTASASGRSWWRKSPTRSRRSPTCSNR